MTAAVREAADPSVPPRTPALTAPHRWLPLATCLGYVAAVLLFAGTSPVDLARYAAYIAYALVLPGTLVYRALRRRPHTLVEDLAMGAAVGLVLELPAWAVFAALDRPGWLWLWPLAVVAVFVAVAPLRRHWTVRGYTRAPVGWSWAVAASVAFFTTYLSSTFLQRNPILPTSDGIYQYLDLAYQLALAGEAKHQFPIHVPQVAGEPLNYHWFGYVHMAATSLIGHIDLPVVALRLAVPGLCAAAIVLTAVVGWRVSGRPYVGAVGAALFFVIGETNFTHPVTMPFGTQASFVIWHGMSMIYSWVLLIALIGVLADIVAARPAAPVGQPQSKPDAHGAGRRRGDTLLPGSATIVDRRADRPVAPIGRPGAFALAALLMFASSGAKASTLPVVGIALAFTAVVLLISRRRIPWAVVAVGLLAGAAQLFAVAVLYRFQTYGVQIGLLSGLEGYWGKGPAALVAAVVVAFLVNMQLRVAGVAPLLWLRRGRLEPVQVLLLGGAIAGPGLYLVFDQPGGANQYFTRAGFTFGVILSAWGYGMVFDRARLDGRAKAVLAGFAAALAVVLVAIQVSYAAPAPSGRPFDPLVPLFGWTAGLTVVGVLAGLLWRPASRWEPALRGRGAVVALTAVLLVGAPGLVMDMYKSEQVPNGGAYANVPMPRSRVEAARWTREHSSPDDVVATNVHCLAIRNGWCDSRSFWLSAYSERRVLVGGWGFAPRLAGQGAYTPFWDRDLLRRNDQAFTAPTVAGLRELRERHRVRWLVVDRKVGGESPDLRNLARLRFDSGRMAVYELS